MTVFAFSEQLLCIYLATRARDWREETCKIFNFFMNICGEAEPSNFQGVHSESGGDVASQFYSSTTLTLWMESSLGIWQEEVFKSWKRASKLWSQQSHLLRQRHELLLQIFALQHM